MVGSIRSEMEQLREQMYEARALNPELQQQVKEQQWEFEETIKLRKAEIKELKSLLRHYRENQQKPSIQCFSCRAKLVNYGAGKTECVDRSPKSPKSPKSLQCLLLRDLLQP